jgi:hypothetical protein
MNSAAELVAEIRSHGANLRVASGDLSLSAPSPLPEPLLARVRTHKADVVALLSRPRSSDIGTSENRKFSDDLPNAALSQHPPKRSDIGTFEARVWFGRLVEAYCKEHWPAPPNGACGMCEATHDLMPLPDEAAVCRSDGWACLIQYGTARKTFGAELAVKDGNVMPEGWSAQ